MSATISTFDREQATKQACTHFREIAEYLYDECKDYRASSWRRRRNHVWRHVIELDRALGALTDGGAA